MFGNYGVPRFSQKAEKSHDLFDAFVKQYRLRVWVLVEGPPQYCENCLEPLFHAIEQALALACPRQQLDRPGILSAGARAAPTNEGQAPARPGLQLVP